AIMGVLTFQENLPPVTQTSIKDFIFKILYKNMASSVNGEAPDKYDYNMKGLEIAKGFRAEEEARRRAQRMQEKPGE
ncbi:MAG: hypothetical protein IKN90_00065, partial [Treponema sp.]|nr:hypothetical protein [Treponema sp.]